jgi:hypothetical protein
VLVVLDDQDQVVTWDGVQMVMRHDVWIGARSALGARSGARRDQLETALETANRNVLRATSAALAFGPWPRSALLTPQRRWGRAPAGRRRGASPHSFTSGFTSQLHLTASPQASPHSFTSQLHLTASPQASPLASPQLHLTASPQASPQLHLRLHLSFTSVPTLQPPFKFCLPIDKALGRPPGKAPPTPPSRPPTHYQ